jgi:hypothetical protein
MKMLSEIESRPIRHVSSRFPVADAPYILDADASLTGIKADLSQVVDEQERLLDYASRTLSKQESNYCVTRREMLAVVHFTKHFQPYLCGQCSTIRTDHSSLQWLRNLKEPEGQLARWLEILQEYDYIATQTVSHGCIANSAAASMMNLGLSACFRTFAWYLSNQDGQHLSFRPLKKQMQILRNFCGRLNRTQSPARWRRVRGHLWPAIISLRDWERPSLIDGVLARQWFNSAGRPAS